MVKLIIIILIILAAYLYLISPRLTKRPTETTEELKKWLYAHRGLHDNTTDAPENSMKAFAKAIEAGYGIELDIQLSKDKIPVVFHDFTLQRICGVNGKVEDYTYEELQQFRLCGTEERIPRFEDVLNLVNGQIPMIVEFKIEKFDLSLCPIADEMLRAYKGLYCMESFNPMGVRWYRQNHPEVVRGQLSDEFLKNTEYTGVLYFLLQHLLFNHATRPDFVAYNKTGYANLSRRLNRSLFKGTAAVWTIKSEAEIVEASKYFDIFIFDSFIPAKKLY